MKAIIQHKYGLPGEVLTLQDVDKPVPADDEVLLRVHASSVNVADWIFVTGHPFVVRMVAGLFRPKHKIPGKDFAGRVEAVGPSVTQFRPGDEVFGEVEVGAYAEYVAVAEHALAPKPANLTFEQAAAVPLAGVTALQGLRDTGRLKAGHKVLINGASGAVGTFSVQIAKALGAEVTGVCSTRNVDMVRSIGADHVSDYTQEDFTRSERRYDLIFDQVGSRSLSDCRRVLEPGGIYISNVGRMGWLFKTALASITRKDVVMMPTMKQSQPDLGILRELIEAGKITPVVDRCYALSEVAEALRHQGEGHARGKKVITVGGQQ